MNAPSVAIDLPTHDQRVINRDDIDGEGIRVLLFHIADFEDAGCPGHRDQLRIG